MRDMPPSVLVHYMCMDDRAAAEKLLQAAVQRMAGSLQTLLDRYDRIDHPLLAAVMEGFAAGIRSTMPTTGCEIADKIRSMTQLIIVDDERNLRRHLDLGDPGGGKEPEESQ